MTPARLTHDRPPSQGCTTEPAQAIWAGKQASLNHVHVKISTCSACPPKPPASGLGLEHLEGGVPTGVRSPSCRSLAFAWVRAKGLRGSLGLGTLSLPWPALPKPSPLVWALEPDLAAGSRLVLGGLRTLWPSSELGLGVRKGPHGLLGAGRAVNALAFPPQARTTGLGIGAGAPGSRLSLGGFPPSGPPLSLILVPARGLRGSWGLGRLPPPWPALPKPAQPVWALEPCSW